MIATTTDTARVLLIGGPVFVARIESALSPLKCVVSVMTEPVNERGLEDVDVDLDVALLHFDPGRGGLSALETLRRLRPRLPVIVVASSPAVTEAVQVMQRGADSYVPVHAPAELLPALRLALARASVVAKPERARRLGKLAERNGLVGDSEAMRKVLHQVALVAPTKTTVLLLGETGTGKERLAQAIHQASPRRNAPFVVVNCAALADALLESELFGHEKGAFTGALSRREGRFRAADGGTIFLDEIGEVSLSIQVKLLRVLQERQIERVGGNETVPVDVRIIAATNRDLRAMVAERTFRADLFYRLNVMAIDVPPLRDRREDVPLLIEHILPRVALDLGVARPELSDAALRQLCAYHWPGNVRELENVIERLVVLSQGARIEEAQLPGPLQAAPLEGSSFVQSVPAFVGSAAGPPIPGSKFWEIERHAILTTFEASGRNPVRTAEMLGLSLRTIHYRLREYRGQSGRRRCRGMPMGAAALESRQS